MYHNHGWRATRGTASRGLLVRSAIAAACCLAPALLSAQAPLLTASVTRPQPGSIITLTLQTGAARGDSIIAISGTMAGEPLHFFAASPGTWRAIGGVPVDASDKVLARVVITRVSSPADTVTTTLELPRPAKASGARRRQLAVAPRFTRPMDAATEARIARENARARDVGRKAHETPPLWTLPFLRPRASAVTSRFGSGRMFNGTVTSRHLGVDFRGAVGAPVNAANRGVVAMVDDFFLAGAVVYIDHGGGLVTSYFHLSEINVAAGDTVERGQQIGLVGASGRVTGPHLHWSGRYGTLTVNPLDLLVLRRP